MARYENVAADYLDNRRLKKNAGWILLWALGVGAVISGDYGGWNSGLKYGGFGGLALATVLMSIMYICMVFTIAELSAALPHAGGFFSFTRNAFGPTGGYLCGLTDAIEYVLTPAVIVYFIGGYMHDLAGQLHALAGPSSSAGSGLAGVAARLETVPAWGWWIAYYVVYVLINIRGVELTLKVGLVITAIAISILVFFFAAAVPVFDSQALTNIAPEGPAAGRWLPKGPFGIFASLPFAVWFYLGIEQLPLAAEESHNAVADMPRALIFGMATLLVLALATLVLNSGVGGGAEAMANSPAPLADGFKAIFGAGAAPALLTLGSLAGLIASFHAIIYAYGRVLFALSRAGYIPRFISLTGRRHTPWVALVLGGAVGLACAGVIEFTKSDGKESLVGAALLNMAVFGAVISYTMVMLSYLKLRIARPNLPRPYRSPLGIPGAAVGAALSFVVIFATFAVEEYRPAIWGVAAFLMAGMLYFALYSRHHLVAQAPEEENALIAAAETELTH
jgi:ethanolamine permease